MKHFKLLIFSVISHFKAMRPESHVPHPKSSARKLQSWDLNSCVSRLRDRGLCITPMGATCGLQNPRGLQGKSAGTQLCPLHAGTGGSIRLGIKRGPWVWPLPTLPTHVLRPLHSPANTYTFWFFSFSCTLHAPIIPPKHKQHPDKSCATITNEDPGSEPWPSHWGGGRLLGALCSASVLPSELPKPIHTDPKAERPAAVQHGNPTGWPDSEPTLSPLCCLVGSLCYFGESSESPGT